MNQDRQQKNSLPDFRMIEDSLDQKTLLSNETSAPMLNGVQKQRAGKTRIENC